MRHCFSVKSHTGVEPSPFLVLIQFKQPCINDFHCTVLPASYASNTAIISFGVMCPFVKSGIRRGAIAPWLLHGSLAVRQSTRKTFASNRSKPAPVNRSSTRCSNRPHAVQGQGTTELAPILWYAGAQTDISRCPTRRTSDGRCAERVAAKAARLVSLIYSCVLSCLWFHCVIRVLVRSVQLSDQFP